MAIGNFVIFGVVVFALILMLCMAIFKCYRFCRKTKKGEYQLSEQQSLQELAIKHDEMEVKERVDTEEEEEYAKQEKDEEQEEDGNWEVDEEQEGAAALEEAAKKEEEEDEGIQDQFYIMSSSSSEESLPQNHVGPIMVNADVHSPGSKF